MNCYIIKMIYVIPIITLKIYKMYTKGNFKRFLKCVTASKSTKYKEGGDVVNEVQIYKLY